MIYNVDHVEGSVTVSAVGPAGPTAVESHRDVTIGPGEVITLDLVDSDALGQELIVETTNRVFVERLLPRSAGLPGVSGSWALPASGG